MVFIYGLVPGRRQKKYRRYNKVNLVNMFPVSLMFWCTFWLCLPHTTVWPQVEGLDEDNVRVVLKLAVGGDTISLSQGAVKLVNGKEYDKYSKYLSMY